MDADIDVFQNFERNGEFFGFIGQLNQAVTGIFNLNRASQLNFSGEEILDQAKNFSCHFLREKQASNQLLDKWVIAKDLPGEVAYALDFPFYASLPRVEARLYIEQYGGGDDIWIGKTLYRMLYVNNVSYLDLAKVDFNQCQSIHQLEWLDIQRWYKKCRLTEYGMVKEEMLKTYFLAASSIFEPDRAAERINWARTAMLAEEIIISSNRSTTSQGATTLLLIRTIELCAGRAEPKGEVARMEYACLTRLAISICNRLQYCSWNMILKCSDRGIESEMQELVQCVIEQHQSPDGLNRETKQTFMDVVKSFYYLSWCPPTTLNNHISKVLFEPVE
ncbi:Ent-copalyl diphosphate synthase 2 [Platanthera zijinensis]|uniref:Ent-copalyl diphosphate synthase 2 n=1 Tax=Platanthera zijinensis TaxID=2320716 RepID=A0AAP0BT00_9ASPA